MAQVRFGDLVSSCEGNVKELTIFDCRFSNYPIYNLQTYKLANVQTFFLYLIQLIKEPNYMKKTSLLFTIIAISLLFISCMNNSPKSNSENTFTFVFMTDIHLQTELNAVAGFNQAIDSINAINPDFVISGGDQIMDALAVSYEEANAAFELYENTSKNIDSPVFNTLGNHDIFGMYSKDETLLNHPEYGENMFENKFGRSYYSFFHKGWKFMILNTVEENENRKYAGLIDEDQLNWIKEELSRTDKNTPIVISTHFPFISAYNQRSMNRTVASGSSWIIKNAKEVLNLFNDYNLKIVLQGHLHIREDIEINGVHYITGGAIAGNWWEGSYEGFEEGFLKFTVTDDDFSYVFVDYGWEVK